MKNSIINAINVCTILNIIFFYMIIPLTALYTSVINGVSNDVLIHEIIEALGIIPIGLAYILYPLLIAGVTIINMLPNTIDKRAMEKD